MHYEGDRDQRYGTETGRVLYLGRDQETARFMATELGGEFELRSLDPSVFYPEVLRDYPPQVAMVDSTDVDAEFVKYLKEQLALMGLADTPIMALFSPARAGEISTFHSQGSSDFMMKPLSPGEVLPRVLLALKKEGRPGILEDLSENREQLYSMLRQMEGPSYAVDGNFRLTFMNRSGREVFGEDFLGRECYRLIYGREAPCRVCSPENREENPVRRWRSSFPDGKDYRFVCGVQVNPRREWEQVVVGSEITEEAELRDIGQTFVANVSHDLKTPLTTLESNLALLLDGAVGEIREEQREFLETSMRSCKRLSSLVDNLLMANDVLGGRLRLKLEVTDLGALIDAAFESARGSAEEKGLVLQRELPPELPGVYCDSDRVTRVVRALLDNAIKFSPRGVVTIGAKPSPASPDRVLVSVSDEGIGIPAKERGRIFDFFHRVDEDEVFVEEGAGLGLALAREIIRGHGGTIWVESEEGRGSTFYITLPVHEPGV